MSRNYNCRNLVGFIPHTHKNVVLDGAALMLTHYCAQGNQARLRLTEASATRFRFEREDATNVLPDQSILTILTLSLEDGALVRTETYVDAQGVPEETVLRFARTPT